MQTEVELLTPDDIAAMLKVQPRQFKERIAKRPGFPRPLNPAVMGSIKRYKKTEVIAWIASNGR